MSNARDYLKKIIVDKNGKEWDKTGTTASKNNILKQIDWIAPIMENYARGKVKNLTMHNVLVRFADYLDKTGTCVHGDIDDFMKEDSKMHLNVESMVSIALQKRNQVKASYKLINYRAMDKETLRTELKKFTDTLINGYTGDSTILELLGTRDCINDYVDNQLRERWQESKTGNSNCTIDIVSGLLPELNSNKIIKLAESNRDKCKNYKYDWRSYYHGFLDGFATYFNEHRNNR